MLKTVFVIASSAEEGAQLIYEANTVGEKTVLVTNLPGLTGTDKVYTYAQDESVASRLGDIAELVKAEQPQLVLCQANLDGRLVAGYVAAALETAPLAEASTLEVGEDGVESSRMVYGGMAMKTERADYPAVAVLGAGVFELQPAVRESAVEPLPAKTEMGLTLVSHTELPKSTGNLAAAKKVIGIGRGLSSKDNLPAVERLAAIMDAAIGGTRPAAEDEQWIEKSKYIGVSGCMLKPNVYLAIGASGQVQHMVGVNKSGVIFAINKDENSPIFSQVDFGLVGDSNTVLTRIADKLEA